MKFKVGDFIQYTDPDRMETGSYKLTSIDENNYIFKLMHGPLDWQDPWKPWVETFDRVFYSSDSYKKMNHYNTKLGKVLYK